SARQSANQQQIRDIRTDNSENESRDDGADTQYRLQGFRIVEWIVLEREDTHTPAAILVRKLECQALGRRIELRLTCGGAHAGPESRKPLDPARRAILELVAGRIEDRLLRSRRPELHRVSHECAEEAFRHDTDDGVRYPVEADRRADDLRIPRKVIPPEAVAD